MINSTTRSEFIDINRNTFTDIYRLTSERLHRLMAWKWILLALSLLPLLVLTYLLLARWVSSGHQIYRMLIISSLLASYRLRKGKRPFRGTAWTVNDPNTKTYAPPMVQNTGTISVPPRTAPPVPELSKGAAQRANMIWKDETGGNGHYSDDEWCRLVNRDAAVRFIHSVGVEGLLRLFAFNSLHSFQSTMEFILNPDDCKENNKRRKQKCSEIRSRTWTGKSNVTRKPRQSMATGATEYQPSHQINQVITPQSILHKRTI